MELPAGIWMWVWQSSGGSERDWRRMRVGGEVTRWSESRAGTAGKDGWKREDFTRERDKGAAGWMRTCVWQGREKRRGRTKAAAVSASGSVRVPCPGCLGDSGDRKPGVTAVPKTKTEQAHSRPSSLSIFS